MNQPHVMGDELRPPHGLMGMVNMSDRWQWYDYAFLVLAVIVLLAVGYLIWRRHQESLRNKKQPLETRDELAIVKGLKWPSHEAEQEEFVYQLAFYLRTAMERWTQIHYTDMTFRELEKNLKDPKKGSANFPVSPDELISFFASAEQIKFQGKRVSQKELQQMYDQLQVWLASLQETPQMEVPERVMA